MEPQYRWHRADESDEFYHCPNHCEKEIYYARFYEPRKGFLYSDFNSNSLLLNFKKGPNKSSGEQYYRRSAIDKFASEATSFLLSGWRSQESHLLIPMPCSKPKLSIGYDDRLDLVTQKICATCSNVKPFPILKRRYEVPASHSSISTRNVQTIYESLEIDESILPTFREGHILSILDDITTSGAHFEAARLHLEQRFPDSRIIGIFWAKSKPAPDDPEDITTVSI